MGYERSRYEILSPAGNPEKLRAAVEYGADAVYLAGNMYGARASAVNFTTEEIISALNMPIFSAEKYI